MLALVVAMLLVSYAYPLRTWWEQHSEREALEAEAQELTAELQRLERELELWDDPAFVAAQARERLGFVMPGEQGYVVIPAEEEVAEHSADGLPPAGSGEWYERLWSSVAAADAEPTDTAGSDTSRSERNTRGSDVDTPDDPEGGETGGDDR